MGLVWKDSGNPKIRFHGRFPEYTPNDMADPALIDRAIARGAFTTPGRQFDATLPLLVVCCRLQLAVRRE